MVKDWPMKLSELFGESIMKVSEETFTPMLPPFLIKNTNFPLDPRAKSPIKGGLERGGGTKFYKD